jgi:hypothetical protein
MMRTSGAVKREENQMGRIRQESAIWDWKLSINLPSKRSFHVEIKKKKTPQMTNALTT